MAVQDLQHKFWKILIKATKPPDTAVLMVLAVVVGIGAGFGSVLFRLMI